MIRETIARLFGALILLAGLGAIAWGLRVAFGQGQWSALAVSLLGVFAALYGLSRCFPGQPPPLPIETDDPLMAAAIERARQHIDRFIAGLAEGRREALVKYPMKTGFGDNEHVWAVAHSIDGDAVVVTLMSEPVGDEAEIKNERTHVPLAEVEDWLLVDDSGRMEGGFTQIAMAQIYKRAKGYVPYAIRKGLPNFADLDDPELLK